jgi:hypothetical protein
MALAMARIQQLEIDELQRHRAELGLPAAP